MNLREVVTGVYELEMSDAERKEKFRVNQKVAAVIAGRDNSRSVVAVVREALSPGQRNQNRCIGGRRPQSRRKRS